MMVRVGFLWVLLCMLLVSAPCLGIGDKPRPPPHGGGGNSTSTLYVQVTRMQTRHPVCVTVQGVLPACLPNVDHDLGQRPPGFYIQPSAPLRILPTAKALQKEGNPELEGSYRHPRYLHFGMFTPPTTGIPGPAISTEPLAEQSNDTGHGQPQQGPSTVTLTITRVQDVVDFRVTATLEAKNCVPVGSRIPFCGQTGLQPPLPPHEDLPTPKKKAWCLFGIQLPWPFNCYPRPDDQEPPSSEVNLEPARAPTEGPTKIPSSSNSAGQDATKYSSGHSHAQEKQKLVLTEDDVSGYLPHLDPATEMALTNSPGKHATKNSPEHIQQEFSLVGEPSAVAQQFTLSDAEETVSSSFPSTHNQEFGNQDYISDDDVNTEQHTPSRVHNSSPADENFDPISQSTDSTSGNLPTVSVEGQDKDAADSLEPRDKLFLLSTSRNP